LRGDYHAALGWYGLALGAYERARFGRGIADVRHNVGITRLDQGRYTDGLEAAERALEAAAEAGDETVLAQALAGRAEIRAAAGDAALARREAERALAAHRALGDGAREAEDLRILARASWADGDRAEAERLLREVTERAETQGRPLLAAAGARDLAILLAEDHRTEEARGFAVEARDRFARLGARAEVEKLERLIAG
jgi:tetratricopeptide (TPR) repeat protein